jgi:hypothetical protein
LQATRPVEVAQSPHAVSFLQPAFGSQLNAGGVPPQVHRLFKGVARARERKRRVRRALAAILEGWR